MTSSRRRSAALSLAFVVGVGLAAAAAATSRDARAQSREPTAQELETARTLYKEGKDLRAAGNLRGAIEKLQAAHALGHTPVTGIELARTYAQAGKLVEAREVALSVARLPVEGDETEKSADARTEAARLAEELRPRIATLTVKIQGLAPGDAAHLVVDGAAVPDAALAEPLKVDPGPHDVVLRVGEGAAAREARGSALLTEGQSAEVTLDVPAQPAAAPPLAPPAPAPAPPPAHTMPWIEKFGFGVAIAGTAIGLYAGAMAIDRKNQLGSECPANRCGTQNAGSSDLDAAYMWASVSTVSFVVGGAGAVAGLVGLLLDHPAPSSASSAHARVDPWFGPGTAGVHGRF